MSDGFLYGPDTSNWQGDPNWDTAIGSGMVDFAIVKCGEGVNFTDANFGRNFRELRRLDVPRWAYHYALPSRNAPEDEADFTMRKLDAVGGLGAGENAALDMEDPDFWGDAGPWSLRYLKRLEGHGVVGPKIYTYPSYVPERSLNEPELAKYGLWWADYDGDEGPFRGPWDSCELWQMNASTTIPGIGGNIDYNRFRGTVADFLALGQPGLVAPPINPDPVTGVWIHEYFMPVWSLATFGHPLAGAALYSDGYIRQLFENGVWRSNGRGNPTEDATGQALTYMTGGKLPDWPDVHPLVGGQS